MKNTIVILLVFAIVSATSGTTTLESGEGMEACFMFSEGNAVAYAGEDYDICLEPWTYPGWCTNYIDMGTVPLDSLTTPPTSGYNDDIQGFEDCEAVDSGHAYWIKTRDGKYAKVKVTEAVNLGAQDTGNLNQVTFDWVYLGTGTSGGTNTVNNNSQTCISTALVLGSLILAAYLDLTNN